MSRAGWSVYNTDTGRVLCPECDGWIVPTSVGSVRVHGKRNNRCPGSGLDPALPVKYVTNG